MELNYIRLLTSHFEDMVEFYTHKMGLDLTHRNDQSKYAELKVGSSSISIYDKSSMAKALSMEEPPTIHECQDKKMIILYTDSLDKKVEELKSKGVILLMDITDRPEWGTRTAHLRDPEGNLIEIYSNSNT